MAATTPAGILCAAVTPFDADGAVDEGALRDLLRHYAGSGVQGIFGLGTASESMLLEPSERRRIAEVIVETLGDDLALLLHCGTPDTITTTALAEHAVSIGVTAVAAIAPYYFAYGASEVEAHYRTVAAAIPDAEMFLYDNPARVGYGVGLAAIERLHDEVPNIVGVKDTGDSIGRVMRYLSLPSPLRVYTGNNELVYASLAVGARGAVSALASAVPELMAHIHRSWEAGDEKAAMEAQLLVVRLMGVIRDMPYLGAIKWLGRRRGLPTGRTRAPQPMIDEGRAAELERRLAAIEGLDPWIAPI